VPATQPLPSVRLGGAWDSGGESVSRTVAIRGDDDAATREYRHGDDLRKVHWRSTARVGRLMVRREERPWQSRATLLLDTRSQAHRGDGPGSSFEWAVSAVASIGMHAARQGYAVHLLTDSGPAVAGANIGDEGVLLDYLAEVTNSRHSGLDPAVSALRGVEGIGTLIAVLGMLDPAQAATLAAARTPSDTSVVILIDTSSWMTLAPRARSEADAAYDAAAEILTRGGWRVVPARHSALLPRLWPGAGEQSTPISWAASAPGGPVGIR
jgi:uncharacterized protein (DUF58 family)